MNDDITIDQFVASMVRQVSRFRDIVKAEWAPREPCSFDQWLARMSDTRGTIYPGERPITLKSMHATHRCTNCGAHWVQHDNMTFSVLDEDWCRKCDSGAMEPPLIVPIDGGAS